ncbi:mCG51722 [Mus musculus]|nr:mCG51722 [Mus musculus]
MLDLICKNCIEYCCVNVSKGNWSEVVFLSFLSPPPSTRSPTWLLELSFSLSAFAHLPLLEVSARVTPIN